MRTGINTSFNNNNCGKKLNKAGMINGNMYNSQYS